MRAMGEYQQKQDVQRVMHAELLYLEIELFLP